MYKATNDMTNVKILGSGSYGCVIHPAIKTNVLDTDEQLSDGSVSKIFKEAADRNKEIRNIRRITERVKNAEQYIVIPIGTSDIDTETLSKLPELEKVMNKMMYQIVFREKGITLYEYVRKHFIVDNTITAQKILDLLKILINVAKGIQNLSKQNILHRDIKDSNIIVTEEGQGKLIDFGTSVEYTSYFSDTLIDESYSLWPPENNLWFDVDVFIHFCNKGLTDPKEMAKISTEDMLKDCTKKERLIGSRLYLEVFHRLAPFRSLVLKKNKDKESTRQLLTKILGSSMWDVLDKFDVYGFGIILLNIAEDFKYCKFDDNAIPQDFLPNFKNLGTQATRSNPLDRWCIENIIRILEYYELYLEYSLKRKI